MMLVEYIKAIGNEIDNGHFINKFHMRDIVIPTSEAFTAYKSLLDLVIDVLKIADIFVDGFLNIVKNLCTIVIDLVRSWRDFQSGDVFLEGSNYQNNNYGQARPKHTIANLVLLIDAALILASRMAWQVCAIATKLLLIFVPKIIQNPLQEAACTVEKNINTFFKTGRSGRAFSVSSPNEQEPTNNTRQDLV